MRFSLICGIFAIAAMTISTEGALIEFDTPPGSTINDLPVGASVTFITAFDTITVVLENVQADPKGVAQNLSSLLFTVSSGQTTGTLTSSVATPRWIAADGSYTDGPADSTGWQLRTTDGQLDLHVLGTPVAPSRTIIGPPHASDIYKSAKGSIADNGPHNPFLAESAQFVLTVPGVTEASIITAVIFGFNTIPGDTIHTPEPTSLCLLAMASTTALAWRRRRKA